MLKDLGPALSEELSVEHQVAASMGYGYHYSNQIYSRQGICNQLTITLSPDGNYLNRVYAQSQSQTSVGFAVQIGSNEFISGIENETYFELTFLSQHIQEDAKQRF